MTSTICTLFEGDYHHGVGALTNSLYANGYRGIIWAGYRGSLPPWATPVHTENGYSEYRFSEECSIRFLPLETDRHLANFKSLFMQDIWRRVSPGAERVFYFDPDIVIKCDWHAFEEWSSCGIALCEDINSPMPRYHFIREQWRRHCQKNSLTLPLDLDIYANAGFVGLQRENVEFLDLWEKIISSIASQVGGLDKFHMPSRPFAYHIGDQDALNMALMAGQFPLSIIGKEGMDFVPGGYTMSHAAGGVKPWKKPIVGSALRGIPPSAADKGYWKHVNSPIKVHSDADQVMAKIRLVIGAGIGRFIRKA